MQDERERVKKCGARILTVDQVEGFEPIHENWGLNLGDEIDENGDPPRIWHPYGQYPVRFFLCYVDVNWVSTLVGWLVAKSPRSLRLIFHCCRARRSRAASATSCLRSSA